MTTAKRKDLTKDLPNFATNNMIAKFGTVSLLNPESKRCCSIHPEMPRRVRLNTGGERRMHKLSPGPTRDLARDIWQMKGAHWPLSVCEFLKKLALNNFSLF